MSDSKQHSILGCDMVPVNAPGEDEEWAYVVPEADLKRLVEQLDAIRFCPYCATGFIPNPPDIHRDSCPGCGRANRLEEELAGTLEQFEALRRAVEAYIAADARYQRRIDTCDMRAALNPARSPDGES